MLGKNGGEIEGVVVSDKEVEKEVYKRRKDLKGS